MHGRNINSIVFSAGLLPAIAKGLLVNVPELQSCCLQLIKTNLHGTLEANDVLSVFTKDLQQPNCEHQLILKDPSTLEHPVWSFLNSSSGVAPVSCIKLTHVPLTQFVMQVSSTSFQTSFVVAWQCGTILECHMLCRHVFLAFARSP